MPMPKQTGNKNKCIGQIYSPNPYILALITAVLAGFFSIVGSYFTAKIQINQTVMEKQFEYKISAYTSFLEKVDRSKMPAISQVLTIGSIAGHLATDGEIQAFEDHIAELLSKHDIHDLYWQLNVDLNILKLHGTPRVAQICDDIMLILLLRHHEIDWSKYSVDVVNFYKRWQETQIQGIAYGWEARISSEERLMIIMMAKLTEVLIIQLRDEMHSASI